MDDEPIEIIERQLTAVQPKAAPRELRSAVLADVQRELRAARWDRRLARAAAVLLVAGVGLNGVMAWRSLQAVDGRPSQIARAKSQQSLVDTAVVVAEATDAATGRRFARQLAAASGRELTVDEAAAVDAAIRRKTNGNRG